MSGQLKIKAIIALLLSLTCKNFCVFQKEFVLQLFPLCYPADLNRFFDAKWKRHSRGIPEYNTFR